MDIKDLFVLATRQRLRFDTSVGQLSVEDLWSLPLTSKTKVNLDQIAVGLNEQAKNTSESFVFKTVANEDVTNKLSIVKFIIETLMEENAAKLQEAQVKSQRARIDELIAQRKDQELSGKSLEELIALRDSI